MPLYREPPQPANTIDGALAAAANLLRKQGIDSPRREARLLLSQMAGISIDRMIADPTHRLSAVQQSRFEEAVGRRARRQPFAYITGQREFWSLPFQVSPATLVPRPDSETVIETVLTVCPVRDRAYRILDLGTGSGCLLLALLNEYPAATGIGVDVSAEAVAVARGNARGMDVNGRADFMVGDWGTGLDVRFDIVVANPPYVATAEIAELAPEVADHEPRLAICGGSDGLRAYAALLGDVGRLLAPTGHAVVEIGQGQAPAVAALMAEHGLTVISTHPDLAGIVRCLTAVSRSPAPRMSEKTLGLSQTNR